MSPERNLVWNYEILVWNYETRRDYMLVVGVNASVGRCGSGNIDLKGMKEGTKICEKYVLVIIYHGRDMWCNQGR